MTWLKVRLQLFKNLIVLSESHTLQKLLSHLGIIGVLSQTPFARQMSPFCTLKLKHDLVEVC